MTKLEKIGADLEKARAKRDEWDQRVKKLEVRYREEENIVIHSMVHAANLTPDMLAHIIEMANQGNVGMYPGLDNEKTPEEENNMKQDEEGYDHGMY